jgi:hypothetical protein
MKRLRIFLYSLYPFGICAWNLAIDASAILLNDAGRHTFLKPLSSWVVAALICLFRLFETELPRQIAKGGFLFRITEELGAHKTLVSEGLTISIAHSLKVGQPRLTL